MFQPLSTIIIYMILTLSSFLVIKTKIRIHSLHHNIFCVIICTGHDYYGRSNAANSLLIWTYSMRNLEFHDNFIPEGCTDGIENTKLGIPAVTMGAGLTWMDVYAEASDRNLVRIFLDNLR